MEKWPVMKCYVNAWPLEAIASYGDNKISRLRNMSWFSFVHRVNRNTFFPVRIPVFVNSGATSSAHAPISVYKASRTLTSSLSISLTGMALASFCFATLF